MKLKLQRPPSIKIEKTSGPSKNNFGKMPNGWLKLSERLKSKLPLSGEPPKRLKSVAKKKRPAKKPPKRLRPLPKPPLRLLPRLLPEPRLPLKLPNALPPRLNARLPLSVPQGNVPKLRLMLGRPSKPLPPPGMQMLPPKIAPIFSLMAISNNKI